MPYQKSYKSFSKAKKYIQSKKFNNRDEFHLWAKSKKKPKSIPYSVERVYKTQWKDWGSFLGTGNKKTTDLAKQFLPFTKARLKVRNAKLRNRQEFYLWVDKHPDIPKGAGAYYKMPHQKSYKSFSKAKKYIQAKCCLHR